MHAVWHFFENCKKDPQTSLLLYVAILMFSLSVSLQALPFDLFLILKVQDSQSILTYVLSVYTQSLACFLIERKLIMEKIKWLILFFFIQT